MGINQTFLLQAIVENFPGGLSVMDADLRVILMNRTARKLLDFPDRLFEAGPPSLEDIFRFNAGRGEYGAGEIEDQVASRMALARGAQPHAFERQRPDGTVLEVRGVPVDGGGFVTTYFDVTERRRSEAQIAYMARHDALTGLANRVLFKDRLEDDLKRVRRGESVAVLCLDVDHFKSVNDTLGHPVGDGLLKSVAERLRSCVRELDTVARLGGDEFAIIQVGAEQPDGATALARRIIEALCEPYEVDGHRLVLGISIGVSLSPWDAEQADHLLKHADMALYRAKAEGRGRYRFFEPEMDARIQARRALELELRRAVAQGEFELAYQPIFEARTQEVSCCEALLRWRHPERGMVSPAEFIPLAEEIGLIVPLGNWVLRQACADAAGWPSHVKVAVNLSPAQFRASGLLQTVVEALAASHLPPQRLELEITEGTLLLHDEATLQVLHHLRALGVTIAMDDFGTGYSSLGYLQRFPINKIKIDRSFIHHISDDDSSLAIIRAVTGLSATLGLQTTAEGVETLAQFERVCAEGCTEVQGFLFSKPKPVAELLELFGSPEARRVA